MKRIMIFAAALILCTALHAAAAEVSPYAVLNVDRNEKSGEVKLTLTVTGVKPGGTTITKTAPDGVAKWDKFDKWYEELFGITYLSDDYGRLWKQLHQRGASFAKEFFDAEMLEAVKGAKLLVVVDAVRPFPADVFRFGDKWLFEIVPIVHSTKAGPKDVGDDYKYKTALVLDCQGPKDREGAEAPGVDAVIGKLPGVPHKMILSLTPEVTVKNLEENSADVLHIATHAEPDEFFPGRVKPGIKVEKLAKLKLRYHTILSTGCLTGNPLFAGAALHDDVRFVIASMYVTSGKDGIKVADVFYKELFSGKTPFESFYEVKKRITGPKPDFPDVLRYVIYVR